MKRSKFKTAKIALAAVMSLSLSAMLSSCGGDENGVFPGPFFGGGFRIIQVNPPDGTEFFDPSSPVRVTFSEAVSSGNLAGSVQVFDITGSTGGGGDVFGTPVQVEVTVDGQVPNELVIRQPNGQWGIDNSYRVTLNTGITSITGQTLQSPFSFFFSTGSSFGGSSIINDPDNPPRIVSVTPDGDFAIAYGAYRGHISHVVCTNESVTPQSMASARFTIKDPPLFLNERFGQIFYHRDPGNTNCGYIGLVADLPQGARYILEWDRNTIVDLTGQRNEQREKVDGFAILPPPGF